MKFKLLKYLIISILLIVVNFSIILANNIQWLYVNNLWYLVGENGQLVFNQWVTYNSKDYHLSEFGYMDTNKWIDNKYYVNENGEKLINTTTPDGYYVNENGEYVENIKNNNTSNVINTVTSNIKVNVDYYVHTEENLSMPEEVESSSKIKNGFHITVADTYTVNDYYNDNKYQTRIKIVIPKISILNNYYFDDKSKIDEINEALEYAVDSIIDDAEDLAEYQNIRQFYLNKYSLEKAFYNRIEVKLMGEMKYADSTSKKLEYTIKYNLYDKEYTIE